jgi:hypothetical protein
MPTSGPESAAVGLDDLKEAPRQPNVAALQLGQWDRQNWTDSLREPPIRCISQNPQSDVHNQEVIEVAGRCFWHPSTERWSAF